MAMRPPFYIFLDSISGDAGLWATLLFWKLTQHAPA